MASQQASLADYKGIKDRTLLKLLKDPTNITVRVGTQDASAVWYIPKTLVTHCSIFFSAALNSHFAEANSNTVSLPDENPETFENFVQWLYAGEIQVDVRPDDSYKAHKELSRLLVESWTLGDMLGCPAFQDAAMTQLLALHWKHAIKPSTVDAAYDGSLPDSELRKWAMEQFLCDVKDEEYQDFRNKNVWVKQVHLVQDFGEDFVKASLDLGDSEAVRPYMEGQMYMEVVDIYACSFVRLFTVLGWSVGKPIDWHSPHSL